MADATRPCEICGRPIDPERIDVLPETRLCSDHAQEIRKYGGEFLVTGTQASLGKGGSLKKNYGDVSVEMKRNAQALRRLREAYEQGHPGAGGQE